MRSHGEDVTMRKIGHVIQEGLMIDDAGHNPRRNGMTDAVSEAGHASDRIEIVTENGTE